MARYIIAVFLGSGIGGVIRYLLSKFVNDVFTKPLISRTSILSDFPWGTFVVNIIGCFLIGMIYGLIDKNVIMSQETKLFLTTGFCGGLTTFSTFSHENLLLFNSSNHITLLIYAILSLIIGFSFAWIGHIVVK